MSAPSATVKLQGSGSLVPSDHIWNLVRNHPVPVTRLVNGADLGNLLGQWGRAVPPPAPTPLAGHDQCAARP